MSATRPYRVLIVDDDPDHVLLIEIVFRHLDANARVSVVWSAEEAIAHLERPRRAPEELRGALPDVIVLDVNMPGQGGVGFLEWYSRRPSYAHIPVVVFTATGEGDLARRCFALGAREFKVKPRDFTELVPIVHGVLDRWHPSRSTGWA